MAGPGKKNEHDAAASFFDGDDWFDEDDDLDEDAGPSETAPAEEAGPVDEPAGPAAVSAEEIEALAASFPQDEPSDVPVAEATLDLGATSTVEAVPIGETTPEPAGDAPFASLDAAGILGLPATGASAAPAADARPRPPVAPPPPPPFFGPGTTVRPTSRSGYLDTILPRTLEPPRLATTPPRVGGGPELVEALGPEPVRTAGWSLPSGTEAWREAIAVLEAEAAHPDAPRADLLVQAARVRLLRLGDADGARKRLDEARAAGAVDDRAFAELRALASEGTTEAVEAWSAYARTLEGAAAADAWRRVAALAARTPAEREALEAALAADPDDVAAAERLIGVLREAGEHEALAARLADLAGRLDPSHGASLAYERGLALVRAGRPAEAVEAFAAVLAEEPGHAGARAALVENLRTTGDAAAAADRVAEAALLHDDAEGAWWWLAARAHRAAGRSDEAENAYARAVEAGCAAAAVDREAWRIAAGRYDGLLADALARPADDPARGAALFRAGVAAEIAGAPPAEVAAAYRSAVEAGFGAAAEPLERQLLAVGGDEIVELLEARVKAWDVPRPADLLRLAEVLEARDPASEEARRRYRAAAESGDVEALRGLARVARTAGATEDLAWALERLADLEPDPGARAARAWELGRLLAGTDPDRAVVWLERAAFGGGEVVVLEALVEALVAAGRAQEAAARLEARADEVGGEAGATWRVAAARLRATSDVDAALRTLDAALAQAPGHAGAQRWLARLSGSRRPEVQQARWRAEGTEAARLAAATWDVLRGADVLDLPAGPAGDELARLARLLRGDLAGFVAASRAQGADADALVVVALEVSPALAGEIVAAASAGSSLLVHVAERLGLTEHAARLAASSSLPRRERERLVLAVGVPAEALAVARRRVEDPEATVAELVEAARVAAVSGDADTRRRALARAVETTTAVGERAALAAALARAIPPGELVVVADAWRTALSARPGSLEARVGCRDALVASRDAEGLVRFLEAFDPGDARVRAEALSAVGAPEAVGAWREAVTSGALLDRLGLEIALAEAGAFKDLFEAWTERLDLLHDADERTRVESKRRWVLAEKLAETDEAWELYQQLHAADPDDREVIENLARIAGARGDVATAVGYLAELVRTAAQPREAARYQRRIAEVHLAAKDDAAARQAWLDALDHDPEDLAALSGLREVAARTEDWETLHTVLKREAGLVSEARRVEVHRELARLAQDRLGDPQRAMDAWRAVLAQVPADEEALRRMFAIAEAEGDDELLFDVGRTLAGVLRGAERSALLRDLGERCRALGRQDDAVHFLEQAVGAEVPDLRAARELEALYRAANDHVGTVRTLFVQADLLEDRAERVACLLEAARIELDVRHDREGAWKAHARIVSDLDPDQPESLRFLATYLYEAGRHAEALPIHERLEPILEQQDDLDDYDVRVEVVTFYFRFAEMLRFENRLAEARQRYEKALSLNAAHLPTLEAVGPIYVAAGDWEAAGRTYQKLLELTGGQGEPEQVAHIFTMLGLVDLRNGRVDKALKRFNRALEALPNYIPALRGLVELHEARQDWQALLTTCNSVIYNATAPRDVTDAYLTKGRVLDEHLGRTDKAEEHYLRSLNYDPAQPDVCLRLMELALRRSDWDVATEYAQRGLACVAEGAAGTADLYLGLALARHQVEDNEAAMEALEKALALSADLAVGDEPLADPELVRRGIHARLPR